MDKEAKMSETAEKWIREMERINRWEKELLGMMEE